LKPFVEEVLRFEAPVQRRGRLTTAPTKILGVPIPKGTVVQCLIGSANRDPKVFSEPEEFRADRQKNRHLSFGLGAHFCMGAQVARMEVSVALRALLQSVPSITLTDSSETIRYEQSKMRRSLLKLSVSLG
jgi:cytochrome P450